MMEGVRTSVCPCMPAEDECLPLYGCFVQGVCAGNVRYVSVCVLGGV